MNLGHLSLISFDPPPGIGFHFSEPKHSESSTSQMWLCMVVLFVVSGLLYYFSDDTKQTVKINSTLPSSDVVERKEVR